MYLVMVVVEEKPQVIAQVKTLKQAEEILNRQTRHMSAFAVQVPDQQDNLMDTLYQPKKMEHEAEAQAKMPDFNDD